MKIRGRERERKWDASFVMLGMSEPLVMERKKFCMSTMRSAVAIAVGFELADLYQLLG